jgi:hypothetical protein
MFEWLCCSKMFINKEILIIWLDVNERYISGTDSGTAFNFTALRSWHSIIRTGQVAWDWDGGVFYRKAQEATLKGRVAQGVISITREDVRKAVTIDIRLVEIELGSQEADLNAHNSREGVISTTRRSRSSFTWLWKKIWGILKVTQKLTSETRRIRDTADQYRDSLRFSS